MQNNLRTSDYLTEPQNNLYFSNAVIIMRIQYSIVLTITAKIKPKQKTRNKRKSGPDVYCVTKKPQSDNEIRHHRIDLTRPKTKSPRDIMYLPDVEVF